MLKNTLITENSYTLQVLIIKNLGLIKSLSPLIYELEMMTAKNDVAGQLLSSVISLKL